MNCSTSGFESLPNYGLPCALTGVLCALSGISGVEVLVNGPSSCTGFSTGVLDSCNPLQERNSRHFSRLAALGHPRIPCSEITDADVILGTGEKLIRAVDILAQKRECTCIVIVNSCSLSLIGEDAATIMAGHPMADKILYLESASCGKPMATGYADALICLMDHLADPGSLPGEPAVNILGLPPYQYSWKHDLAEIRRLMAMAGIRINTILSDN